MAARIPAGAEAAVGDVLRSGYIAGGGEAVERFERELAAWLDCDPACLVTTNSGTSALFLALHVAGVRGGRVATTPMTFLATTTAIYQAGAQPEWMDVGERSCLVDRPPGGVRIPPAATMVVLWGGYVPDLDGFRRDSLAPLIVDAAQALGAGHRGRPVHRFADFTCYSFAPTKHLTTGDGGAVVCRDPNAAERVRRLAWFGMRRQTFPPERYPSDQNVAEAGFKMHMNSLAAALGRAGLAGLDDALGRCRAHAARYSARIGTERAYAPDASPWTYTVFLDDVPDFIATMEAEGVQVGQPHRRNDRNVFAARCARPLPNTEWAQAHYCSIPVGWWLTDADASRIADLVAAYPGLLR